MFFVSFNSHRTLLPLIYPPHTIALGSIYVAGLLLSFEQPPSPQMHGGPSSAEIAQKLNSPSSWEKQYHTQAGDLEGLRFVILIVKISHDDFCFLDFAHTILDLLIQYTQNPSANTSPSTPSSPSPHPSARDRQASQQQLQSPYKPDQLIRLKIAMRETEHPPRRRKPLDGLDPSALYNSNSIGQNEGTVRFLFSPPGFEGDMS